MKQTNAVLRFFPLGLVEQILTKHRVPNKLSYLIMIFNYQPKKEKKFKEKMKLRPLNFIEKWGGGLYRASAFRITGDFKSLIANKSANK